MSSARPRSRSPLEPSGAEPVLGLAATTCETRTHDTPEIALDNACHQEGYPWGVSEPISDPPVALPVGFPEGNPDERELLLAWLGFLRGAVLRKLEGLDDEQARWR